MKNIVILLCLTALISSCVKENVMRGGVEGEPVVVSFALKGATMDYATKALSEEEDKNIENVHILIFNAIGNIVTNKHFADYKGVGSLNVETYSGADMTIVVIANDDAYSGSDVDLYEVKTLSELENITVKIKDINDFTSPSKMMMVGRSRLDIAPNSNTSINIKLDFVSAKVTLKVTDNTPPEESVTILGWELAYAPAISYIVSRDGDGDAVEPWVDNHFAPECTGQFSTSNNVSIKTFYFFEYQRGERVKDITLPPKDEQYPEMSHDDTDQRGKEYFAPWRSQYIIINGVYLTTSGNREFLAKVYLGANNYNDYNTDRSNHYTLDVTINGFKDIKVDTRVDYVPSNASCNPSVILDMDAHPDSRPIQITAPNGLATIEILDAQNRAYDDALFEAKWLKISPLNLIHHQVKQDNADNNQDGSNDDHWQQNGVVGDFVRAKYIPHKSVRDQIANCTQPPVGKELDDEMSFNDATYRMCYKIKDIPFSNISVSFSEMFYIYADEFLDIQGSRNANIKITFLKEGDNDLKRETIIIPITQKGPITIFDMDDPNAGLARLDENGEPTDVKRKFVIEQFEESTMYLNPNIDQSVQQTNSMQWGFSGIELYDGLDKYRNGYLLTANAVYSDVNRVNNEPTNFGTVLRDKYGNNESGKDPNVIPNYGSGTTSNFPYYHPDATKNIYHPIYKSSAARYCHEKNRDINGDGIIDASETKWYLPSQNELQLIWISGFPIWNGYWSSTEDGLGNSRQLHFYNGTVGGIEKSRHDIMVRCIREI